MIGGWLVHRSMILVMALVVASAPASAHKKKHHQTPAAAAVETVTPGAGGNAVTSVPAAPAPNSSHGSMSEMMDDMEDDRESMSTVDRLLDWFGRLHPVIVHFPIAFFPAALFTAVVGRRRPAFGKPVQFLVVAGGIIAPIAAVLGWLDAIGVEPSPFLNVHRWLGTGVGIGALALAIWAWRRPDRDRSMGMIVALAAITAAIIVQGWYGGALVHGMDHMNW